MSDDLDLGGARAEVVDFATFAQRDPKLAEGFISNFGTWELPADAAAALGSPKAHLEWSHDTGELFALGAVPDEGVGSIDVPRGRADANFLGVLGGGESTLATRGEVSPGLVREFFPAETVPAGTKVAVLAVIKHGWRVHEVLWGWHREQHSDEGWQWLVGKLADLRDG